MSIRIIFLSIAASLAFLLLPLKASADYVIKLPYEGQSPALNQEAALEPDPGAWESFAIDNNLPYTNWSLIDWRSKSLTTLPSELYPLTSGDFKILLFTNQLESADMVGFSQVTTADSFSIGKNSFTNVNFLSNLTSLSGVLYLHENALTDITGLSKLSSVGSNFYLYKNNLTNLNGLESLTSIGGFLYAYDNQLSNVNGLSALKSVSGNLSLNRNNLSDFSGLENLETVGGQLNIQDNPILDIRGLSNVKVSYQILLSPYSGPKMAANSRFCLENDASLFLTGIGQRKIDVCVS